MVDVIDIADLASYLRDDTLADNTYLQQLVSLTNALLTEEWTTPSDPVPAKITLLALNVAARAWANDPSKSNLESYSRALDDATKSEKYRASNVNGSIYLTEAEEALLNGRKSNRSVRLTIYGTT